MISAKQANIESKKNQKNGFEEELVEIEESIKTSIEHGRTSCYYSQYMPLELMKTLKEFGYDVEDLNERMTYSYLIKW